MTAQVGDIVTLETGLRYVVLEFVGNPSGGRDAKLLRKNSNGTFTGFQKNVDFLIPVETPSFQPGEAVTVDGFPGQFMSLEAESHVARIMLAPRRRQLGNGTAFVHIEASVARANLGWFVLENRKV
jgi:hypothetical protein